MSQETEWLVFFIYSNLHLFVRHLTFRILKKNAAYADDVLKAKLSKQCTLWDSSSKSTGKIMDSKGEDHDDIIHARIL